MPCAKDFGACSYCKDIVLKTELVECPNKCDVAYCSDCREHWGERTRFIEYLDGKYCVECDPHIYRDDFATYGDWIVNNYMVVGPEGHVLDEDLRKEYIRGRFCRPWPIRCGQCHHTSMCEHAKDHKFLAGSVGWCCKCRTEEDCCAPAKDVDVPVSPPRGRLAASPG